jgi:hypothetical protein
VARNHTFSGPFVKIARARKHLAELEAEIAAFLSTQPVRWIDRRGRMSRGLAWFAYRHRLVRQSEIPVEVAAGPPEPTRRIAEVEGAGAPNVPIQLHIQLPPEHLGAIIGDIVHNLRSALDLAACDMVRAAEGKEANVERVYFPFCRSAEDLDRMIRVRDFHRAGDQAVELLRGLKPYHGGNAALRAIHDLDIQDKHTSLILAITSASFPINRSNDDGSLRIIARTSKVAVAFPPGSVLAGQEVIPTSHQLVELTLGVVEAFRVLANS